MNDIFLLNVESNSASLVEHSGAEAETKRKGVKTQQIFLDHVLGMVLGARRQLGGPSPCPQGAPSHLSCGVTAEARG